MKLQTNTAAGQEVNDASIDLLILIDRLKLASTMLTSGQIDESIQRELNTSIGFLEDARNTILKII